MDCRYLLLLISRMDLEKCELKDVTVATGGLLDVFGCLNGSR